MAQGLTLEQMKSMGAKPITPNTGGGLTLEQMQSMGAKPVATSAPAETPGYLSRVGSEIKGAYQGLQKTTERGAELLGTRGKEVEGAVMSGLGAPAAFIRAAFSPITAAVAPLISKGIESSGLAETETFQKGMAGLAELAKTNPDAAENIKNIVEIGGALIGTKAVTSGVKAVEPTVSRSAQATGAFTQRAGERVSGSVQAVKEGVPGVIQTAKELAARAPKAFSRGKEGIAEAGERATKIKAATPAVQNAIKSNLDERIINTVGGANKETRQAYKEVLDIAEKSPTTIGVKKQPTIVGGEAAVKQYDIVNAQKKSVGKKIGDTARELSKTTSVDLVDSFKQMDDLLSQQGIKIVDTPEGRVFDLTGSGYTTAQRAKIQELYRLATEGGNKLSPSQIRTKDKLFSTMQRESRMEGMTDIMIDTPDGAKNLFSVFRDSFSNKLDEVSPEMRVLNTEYRKLVQLTDDIEDSIFKTPNFNVTKNVDGAEFAKVNLRRIFGEAQSSPVYEAVADAMDAASRGLGYKGASPKVVAEFAQEMRKLFPETIPKTGFTGGIKMGLGDLVETVTKTGAPNLKDQQRALRELLDSSFGGTKKTNFGVPKPLKKDVGQTYTDINKTMAGKGGLSMQDVSKKAPYLDKHGTPTTGSSLADPVEGGTYYHGTITANKPTLLKSGFDIAHNKKGFAEQPEAFYFSDYPGASMYGNDMVGVQVKPGQTIKTLSSASQEWADTLGKSRGTNEAAKIMKVLRSKGYDAINYGNEIEVLNPGKFKIIDTQKTKSLYEQVTGKNPEDYKKTNLGK